MLARNSGTQQVVLTYTAWFLLLHEFFMLEPGIKYFIGRLQQISQRQGEVALLEEQVPGSDSTLKTISEELRKSSKVIQPTAHVFHQIAELGLQILLNAVVENSWKSDERLHGLFLGETKVYKKLHLGH